VIRALLAACLLCGAAHADGLKDIGAAIGAQNHGQYQIGIVLYTSAIQDPQLSAHDRKVAFYDRADAYQAEGEYDLAIGDYSELLRLDPQHSWAYYNRGESYWSKGDKDKAIADFDQVVRLDPRNARAWGSRGNAYRARYDYPQALADYDAALRLDAADAWIFRLERMKPFRRKRSIFDLAS